MNLEKNILSALIIISALFADIIKPEFAEDLRTIHVLFEWEQEPDAIEYNLQISDSFTFNNIITNINEETTSYIEKNNLENEKEIEDIKIQKDEIDYELDNLDELSKNYDFSIINDNLLEKHAYNQLS